MEQAKKTIKQIRYEHGMKGKFVAEKLGMDQPTYSNKENGKRKFTAKDIAILCDLFDVNIRDIRDLDNY